MSSPAHEPLETEGPVETPTPWSLPTRIAFRFVFAYAVLYMLPFPAGSLPWTYWISGLHAAALNAAALRVGRHLLGITRDISVEFNGSGDRTLDWLQALTLLILAALAAVAWSIADRRRREYRWLHGMLRVSLRYYLAFTMLGYGLAKVFKTQFPFPPLVKMVQPLGDSSPMGLLWTFMGTSTGYNVFCGAMEVVAGALLLFRRTTTLGALLTAGVMANILAMNLFYDVPVKLFSAHLMLLAVVLLAPEMRRLLDVFVFNRRVEPAELGTLTSRPRLRKALVALKVVVVLYVAGTESWSRWQVLRDRGKASPVFGLWEVKEFQLDGTEVPPILDSRERWRWVSLESWGARIHPVDGEAQRYKVTYDEKAGRIELQDWFAEERKPSLAYVVDGDALTLEGDVDGKRVMARMRRVDPQRFLLVNRGFHWINERPYNR